MQRIGQVFGLEQFEAIKQASHGGGRAVAMPLIHPAGSGERALPSIRCSRNFVPGRLTLLRAATAGRVGLKDLSLAKAKGLRGISTILTRIPWIGQGGRPRDDAVGLNFDRRDPK